MSRGDGNFLDQRFAEILAKIKPYLLRLPVGPESHLCQQWLERLDVAHDQRYLRNDYLMELYKQLKNCQLKNPFNKLPDDSKLIPLAKHHRLVSASSCNEVTDTSPVLASRRSRPKLRSKSVHRHKSAKGDHHHHHHFHSELTSSCTEHHDRCMSAGYHLPSVEEPPRRSPKSLLKTYRGKIETLAAVIHELETENEALRQKLYYYSNSPATDEVPELHSRINQLVAEVASLKSKIKETNEIKAVLMKNHNEVVEQYKTKLMEQFNKMKFQLENARTENQELNEKIALVEQKLQELNSKKEQAVQESNVNWEQKIESIKSKLETLLKGKEAELKLKDSIIQEKDKEIALKRETIENMQKKMESLKQSAESKNQDDGKLQFMLLDQYKSMKNELKKMKNDIEEFSQQQTESRVMEVTNLKKKMRKLEKYIWNFQQKYELEISHLQKEKKKKLSHSEGLGLKKNYDSFDEKIYEVTSYDDEKSSELKTIDDEYKNMLTHIESTAGKRLTKHKKKMNFIKMQLERLHGK